MKIAQVAPLYESVPPRQYGGTERVVSYLTEKLVEQGHDVTLFASGDSVTRARLVPGCDRSLRLNGRLSDPVAYHFAMLERVFREAPSFDVIHSHVDYLHFPFARRHPVPQVATLHGRLDAPDLMPLYREYCELPFVSISNAQREPLPWINWVATVYHGLPIDLYSCTRTAGKYLAFLGRVSPEKGLDRAIQIARDAGMEIKIAAKIGSSDRPYMDQVIKPLLDGSHVEFIGEIKEKEKKDFLENAYALLFPIDWPEPFGLVLVEAMACGTPVIACRRGSVPELIEEGVTGFIVENQAEAVKAVERVSTIDRQKCRGLFEERFTADQMAKHYLELYQRLLLGGEAGLPNLSRPESAHR